MDTPGYDPVAATGQVAGGANLVCFTTGRGSRVRLQAGAVDQAGDQHADVQRIEDDMDVNCGTILDGDETVQECGAADFRADAARGERASGPRASSSTSARRSSRRG